MKKFVSNKFLILFSLFFQYQLFAMQVNTENEPTYDVQAYERLKAYSKGEGCDNNLFQDYNLEHITLIQRDLSKINLKNSLLERSDLTEVLFIESGLKKLKLKRSSFAGINFVRASLSELDFSKSVIMNSIFRLTGIVNSNFFKTEFINCQFSTMKKKEKGIEKCFFYKNKLDFAQFKFCYFDFVGFKDNSFIGTSIKNTTFKDCIFSGIDFKSSSMENVLFNHCVFIDYENLDTVFYVDNVEFSSCDFFKKDVSENDTEELLSMIKRCRVRFSNEPGAMDRFKNIAGSLVVPAARIGVSFATGASYEFGKVILGACNDAYSRWSSNREKSDKEMSNQD